MFKKLDKDPRSEAEIKADESALKAIEAGEFLAVNEKLRENIIKKMKDNRKKNSERL